MADDLTPAERRRARIRQRVELLSALLLALATVATAWSAYQSARWGGEQNRHRSRAAAAGIKVAKFTNLAEQRLALHVTVFSQWAAAYTGGNTKMADFTFARFPEPLKSAAVAWRATRPFEDPNAPATPFVMAEYALPESAEAARWEATGETESAAAEAADDLSDRYVLFTIIFASVLFFGGISGKFDWLAIDVAVLAFGVLALVAGVAIMIATPMR